MVESPEIYFDDMAEDFLDEVFGSYDSYINKKEWIDGVLYSQTYIFDAAQIR